MKECSAKGHVNQGVLDAIQQGKADLGYDPPASDQEAIPDSANHFLSQIAGIESQKPLYRVVLRVDTMPGLLPDSQKRRSIL